MNKKMLVASLTFLTVIGSLFMVQASNMFFDDVFNFQVKFSAMTVAVTVPAASIAIMFVLGTLYVIRLYKHPDCFKRLSITYLIHAAVLGCIGAVMSIVSAITVYHSMTSVHPFAGYSLIFMIFNIVATACSIGGVVLLRKRAPDQGKIKVNFPYAMKSLGWYLFIALMFNRFGLLLGAPAFIYWRNFYATFPAYLFLLLPVFLGVLKVFQLIGLFDRKKNMILAFVAIGLDVALVLYIALMGINDTTFTSSLSQLYPLERMAAKPVELPIHFLAYLGVGISLLVTNRVSKEKKEEK